MNSPGITIIVVGECRVDVEVEVRRSAPTSTSTLAYRTDTNDTSPRSFGETKSLTSRKTYRKKCNRVDLGRVGPGGVLYYFNALDMDEEGNLHTETVTAATPIHAYTISRGDFCYKLESDTREAVIREIARDTGALRAVTDEEWRKSQAWVGFKKAMSMGEKNKMENKNRSIIDSYRLLERVSYCSPSQAPVSHRRVGTPSMSPDGTPFSKTDGNVDGKKSITFTRDKHESTRVGDYDDDIEFIRKSLGTSRGPLGLPGKSKGKRTVWSSEPDSDVAASIRDMEAVALHDSKNVQKAIQRNKSRVGPKKHRLTFLNSRDSPSPLQPGTPMTYAEGTFSGIDLSTIGPVSGLEIMAESRMKVLPFSLVHVHREIINVINENDQNETRSNTEAKSNTAAGTDLALLGGRRKRLFRCHLRLCGTMKSPEAARECAEAQIQQAMLHGNQNGDTEQQSSQSHIVWRKFSGFEAIPSHHTDHFISECSYHTKIMQYSFIAVIIFLFLFLLSPFLLF